MHFAAYCNIYNRGREKERREKKSMYVFLVLRSGCLIMVGVLCCRVAVVLEACNNKLNGTCLLCFCYGTKGRLCVYVLKI